MPKRIERVHLAVTEGEDGIERIISITCLDGGTLPLIALDDKSVSDLLTVAEAEGFHEVTIVTFTNRETYESVPTSATGGVHNGK